MTSPTVSQLQQYTELLEELSRRKRLESYKTDILAFGQYYFRDRIFTTDSPQFHRDLADAVEECLFDRQQGHFLAIAAPRSHAKSMVVTVVSTLWAIVHGYHYVLVISAKQDIAKQLLQIIKNELLNNEKLIADYGDMYSKDVWNSMEIVTSNGCKVQAAGAGDSLRGLNFNGYRPEIIVLDDIERDPDVDSATYREQMKQWLNSVVIPLGNPGKTHVLFVGTILHSSSVLKTTMTDDPRFKSMTFSAIKEMPTNMHHWDKWAEILMSRSITDGGEDDSAFQSAQKARQYYEDYKAEMDAGSSVLWSERMPLYDLMVIRYTQRKTFQTEYMQIPRDESMAIFTNFVFYDELPPLDQMDIYGSCDPSLGKTARSDPSCIMTIGKHKKTGVIYVIDVNTKRRSPDTIIADILRLATVYDYKLFAIETVAFQEFMSSQLQERAQIEGIRLPLKSVKPLTDKKMRISSLEPYIANGLIRFGRHHGSLVEELKDFPTGNHDDQCDALEMSTALTFKQKRTFIFDKF